MSGFSPLPRWLGVGRGRWVILSALVVVWIVSWFGLTAPSAARAEATTQPPVILPTDPPCVECHAYVSNDVVTTWRSQDHGSNQVGCPICHGTHDQGFRPKPTAEVCFRCHDVATVHPELGKTLPAARCMECHTANVHILPGQGSWFQGGLPASKLEGSASGVPAATTTSRVAAAVVAAVAVVLGIVAGLLLARLARPR